MKDVTPPEAEVVRHRIFQLISTNPIEAFEVATVDNEIEENIVLLELTAPIKY